MEASDVFAREIDEEADPFDGTDFGDFAQPEPSSLPDEPVRPVPEAEAPVATEALPVVDREGNRMPPVAPEPTPEIPPAQVGPTPEAQAAMDALKQKPGEVALTHMVAGAEIAARETSDAQPPESGDVQAAEAEAAVPPTPEPSPSSSTTASPPDGSSSETEPGASSEPPSSEVPTPEAVEVVGGDDSEASLPEEKKDSSGRVTHRRYLVLRVEGNGKYTEITWHEDKKGSIVPRSTPGAKRQKYALARGQEDALKIGYAALGSPPRAHIVAVALSSFQARVVEPEAPKPERARLKIS